MRATIERDVMDDSVGDWGQSVGAMDAADGACKHREVVAVARDSSWGQVVGAMDAADGACKHREVVAVARDSKGRWWER